MTRAQGLSDFASGLGDTLKVDGGNNRVGINSTAPTEALDVVGNIKVSGSISGGSFTGIGVTSLKDSGGSVKVQANTSGIVVTGVSTFTGNVSVGGTLTYEDVTNVDSVGIITARSDVSIADKIIHTGDTDTAIRFPANDTFTVETAGVERLRISNNVGVGDDNPNVQFNVKGSGTSHAGINVHAKLEDTTSLAADVGGLLALEGVYNSGGSDAVFAAIHGGKENATDGNYQGYFRVLTRPDGGLPVERVRVTSTGLFGVGTNNPQLKFVVSNNNALGFEVDPSQSSGTVCGVNAYDRNASAFKPLRLNAEEHRFDTSSTERLRITSSGIALFKSGLAEKVNVKSQLTSANDCAITDGNVILTTTNEPGNTYPNITGVHSVLTSGQGFSVTIALKVNGSGTINGFYIDGQTQTIEWSGGSAPSAGGSGYDIFTFTAIKTGSGATDYTVFGAATNHD